MDNNDLKKLIKAHDGNVALLYIYICANGRVKHEQIACDLCMTISQVEEAEEKLKLMEIYPYSDYQDRNENSFSPKPSAVETIVEPKSFTSEEITATSDGDPTFKLIIDKATIATGRYLGRTDLEKLLDIYRNLELPADVIYVLINYCEKISSYRKPTINFIKNEAYKWYRLGITTSIEAEEYSDKMIAKNSQANEVKKVLGIVDRDLKPTEREYIESWLDSGYTLDQIERADDITYTKTNKRVWKYMDTVLKNLDKEKSSSSTSKRERKPLPNPDDIIKKQRG